MWSSQVTSGFQTRAVTLRINRRGQHLTHVMHQCLPEVLGSQYEAIKRDEE